MVIRTLVNHCKGKIGYAVIFFIYSKVKRAVLLKFDEMLVSKKKDHFNLGYHLRVCNSLGIDNEF